MQATIYRSGLIVPSFRQNQNSIKNLKQGTCDANRYIGKLNMKARETFVSRAIFLAENSSYRLKTFILTYRLRTDEQKDKIEKVTKSHLNTFLTGLKKLHRLRAYLYTLEKGENGLIHYHFIVDMPFIKVQKLNDYWSKVRGDYSANAVREFKTLGKGNTLQAAKYASKYFTKTKDNPITGLRLWATSNNLKGTETTVIENIYTVLDSVEHTKHTIPIKDDTGRIVFEFDVYKIDIKLASIFFKNKHYKQWDKQKKNRFYKETG